jgi:hypothetical protein
MKERKGEKEMKPTYYHEIRVKYEQITEYLMVLQEQGKVGDELYFGNRGHEDCQMTLGNECGRYINAPRETVGYPENGAI